MNTSAVKDAFYGQLDTVVRNVSSHDDLVVLGYINAVTETSCTGFESVSEALRNKDLSLKICTGCAQQLFCSC